MLVSVVMSTYNEPLAWVESATNSILKQSYTELEFIVVVDNPQNHEIINFLKEMATKDSRLKVIVNSRNMGLVWSLNNAINLSSGAIIARMDADDISTYDRIEKQIEYLKKYNLDIVGGGRILIDEQDNVRGKELPIILGSENTAHLLAYQSIVFHPTWLVKSKVYEELDFYRDIHAAEDYDLLLRALLRNYKIDNLNQTILYYRVRETSISNQNRLRQFLTSKYLQKAYNAGKEVDIRELQMYLDKRVNEKNILRYERGQNYLRKAKSAYYDKSFFRMIVNVLSAVTTSKFSILYSIHKLKYEIAVIKLLRKEVL